MTMDRAASYRPASFAGNLPPSAPAEQRELVVSSLADSPPKSESSLFRVTSALSGRGLLGMPPGRPVRVGGFQGLCFQDLGVQGLSFWGLTEGEAGKSRTDKTTISAVDVQSPSALSKINGWEAVGVEMSRIQEEIASLRVRFQVLEEENLKLRAENEEMRKRGATVLAISAAPVVNLTADLAADRLASSHDEWLVVTDDGENASTGTPVAN